MTSRIKNVGLRMRTAYCLDSLRQATGLGVGRLESRIRLNQYEAHGLSPPSPATVKDFFLLRRCPAVDGTRRDQPSWLFAAELEFPGVAFNFFHPIFDLLLEPIQSSPRWMTRMERVPQVWIDQALERGDELQAQEWMAFNEALEPKRGRPPRQAIIDPLTLVHLAMLRLPRDCSGHLFERTGLASTYARTYEPVDEEVSRLVEQGGAEALAALIGLVKEATLIGDRRRLSGARQGVRDHQRAYGLVPALARVEGPFTQLLESVQDQGVRRYSTSDLIGSAFPVTWQARIYGDMLERDHERVVARALKLSA